MTPLLLARRTALQLLAILFTATLITPTRPIAAQTPKAQARSYDALQAFVGSWTARNANESTPFLFLKFRETDGKLTGTISHFTLHAPSGRAFQPLIGAEGPAGETPITDIKVGWEGVSAVLDFMWSGDAPLQGGRITFTVEGTETGFLTLPISSEEGLRMLHENNSGGFDPRISVTRQPEGRPEETAVPPSWPPNVFARFINMAETQYKFAHGVYADYATLFGSGQLRETSGQFKLRFDWLQSGPEPLYGYRFRFFEAQDGSSYQFSLVENAATGCGTDFFSNESGIIYQGRSWDCPAK